MTGKLTYNDCQLPDQDSIMDDVTWICLPNAVINCHNSQLSANQPLISYLFPFPTDFNDWAGDCGRKETSGWGSTCTAGEPLCLSSIAFPQTCGPRGRPTFGGFDMHMECYLYRSGSHTHFISTSSPFPA